MAELARGARTAEARSAGVPDAGIADYRPKLPAPILRSRRCDRVGRSLLISALPGETQSGIKIRTVSKIAQRGDPECDGLTIERGGAAASRAWAREACSGFGKIATKMFHAFSSSCDLRICCAIPSPLTVFRGTSLEV
jgi:hypothetical protein